MSKPTNSISFLDTMADILRLPDESLAMAYLYLNKYKRFQSCSSYLDPLDAPTLSLASLSLASKSTESPRRLREILLPAHRLLHPRSIPSSSPPLTIPSPTYDILRATIVQAELLLLRVLGFDLRIPLPLDFLPRYLARAMEEVVNVAEDYDGWDGEVRNEYGVVDRMETGIARACRAMCVDACKNHRLVSFFPARAVAAGCLYLVLQVRGLQLLASQERWVDDITSGKVDVEDFDEVLEELRAL